MSVWISSRVGHPSIAVRNMGEAVLKLPWMGADAHGHDLETERYMESFSSWTTSDHIG
jgi:hypothetical protein